MINKILNGLSDFKDYAFSNFPMVWACILTFLMFILVNGLVAGFIFGYFCLIGWLLSLVYGALAVAFAWPTFSFWFFVAASVILNLFLGQVRLRFKKG